MEIIMRKVSDLIPYAKNAKKHDQKQIDNVANSIRRFGWQQPIVIDENNVVVIGHCRLLAAKQLKQKEVPCTVASGLTDEEIRELRIADNKTNESPWDFEMLDCELPDLNFEGFALEGFDFDMEPSEISQKDETNDNARERTIDAYNLGEFYGEECEGYYQMPILWPCDYVPDDLIGFNYMLSSDRHDCGVHFYVDDYQFERVWNQPQMYLEKMRAFQCMLTPDFSLYTEMPVAMKVWNIYRSRLIGQIAQRMGLNVIPTVSWCEEKTFDFCFDGLPKHSTLSISTIGIKRADYNFGLWKAGVDEMIHRLKPKTLLIYGGKVDYDYGNIKTVYYENKVTERLKERNKRED